MTNSIQRHKDWVYESNKIILEIIIKPQTKDPYNQIFKIRIWK